MATSVASIYFPKFRDRLKIVIRRAVVLLTLAADTLLGTVQHLGAGQTRHLTATIGTVVLGLYRVRFYENALARRRTEIFSKRRLQLTQTFLQVGTFRRLRHHCDGSTANCVE